MNNPLLLTQFNPAEILVFLKGYNASTKELISALLYTCELNGQIRFYNADNTTYVCISKVSISSVSEYNDLIRSYSDTGSRGIQIRNYVRVLVERFNDEKLTRRILKKLKKAGYFSQNALGWLTGNFEITSSGKQVQQNLRTEIRHLSDLWQKTVNKPQMEPLLRLLGANSCFLTGRYSEGVIRFEALWEPVWQEYQKELEMAQD